MPEWMVEFPEVIRIPLDEWVEVLMTWVVHNFGGFTDAIGDGLQQMLVILKNVLLWLPWLVIVLLVGVLAWRVMRRWWAGPVMAGLMFLIGSFGYWEQAMLTLSVMIAAVILSLVVGIPAGIIMAKSDRVQYIVKPVLDAMQTMPSFVYLIPALMLFGIGQVTAVFATIIYAIPPITRLTNLGIRQVAPEILEAAQAFGSTPLQLLIKVQLPLAIPSIMVGVNQTTMMALGMSVVAAMVGAGGLGIEVLTAINRVEVGHGFTAGLCIVLLAIIIDRITGALAARREYKIIVPT